MDKERILAALREHETELRAAGLLHLRLFGSVARGESTPASDVDLLADYDETKNLSLLGVVRIQHQLEEILGKEVHLASEIGLRPRIRNRVLQEQVIAF